jgi:hypothetical protein
VKVLLKAQGYLLTRPTEEGRVGGGHEAVQDEMIMKVEGCWEGHLSNQSYVWICRMCSFIAFTVLY